jgi:hypothetical protein
MFLNPSMGFDLAQTNSSRCAGFIEGPLLIVGNQRAKRIGGLLERSPSIGAGRLNAKAVRDNRELGCGVPGAPGEMRAICSSGKGAEIP